MSAARTSAAAAVGGLAILAMLGATACTERERTGEAPRVAQPSAAEERRASASRDDAADFSDCPEGTAPRELSLPATATVMRWCEREGPGGDRIQHGPWEKRQGGTVVERGRYYDGVRHGRWTLHWSSGQPQSEGEYHNGRRSGVWTFWREDGTVIRRYDYGDRASEVIEIASPDAEEGGATGAEVTLQIENGRATDLVFTVEPSTQAWAMPPGASFEVRTRGGSPARIRVEATENGITVWPEEGAETSLLADGVEIER